MPATQSGRVTTRQVQGSPGGFQDAPSPWSPAVKEEEGQESEVASKGISILQEIFPDHGVDAKSLGAKASKQPGLQQLLGSIPSPARAHQFGGVSSQPFAPPTHAPMAMVAPVMPPPPVMAAPTYQEQWEAPRNAAPPMQEQGFPVLSYRERLRAGGRGAFQRAFDTGLMPTNMKQEGQTGAAPYGDANQMWSGAGQQMPSNDYAYQAQYSMPMQQPQQQQQMPLMMPQMAMQQPSVQMPMLPGEQSPPMGQMHMPAAMMQLPQMAMSSGMQTPISLASGESTPTEIESMCRRECMAMLMPQNAQGFPEGADQDLLALQLRASAEMDGRYED